MFASALLTLSLLAVSLSNPSNGLAQPAAPATAPVPATPPAPAVPAVPAAPSAALARLEKSPRHQEWVTVKHGDRTVTAFVVYPEVKGKALAVIVIHENRGLNDWTRAVADRLAEHGYIAIAPDLLSGAAPGGGNTRDFASVNEAGAALGKLPPEQIVADLNAVADYARADPAANGQVAVIGFCWGGTQVWRFALARPGLALASVFYGRPPADADYTKITSPVHGYYGGEDSRVNSTIENSTAGMTAAGKVFEPVIYAGAGHAFMRSGEDAGGGAANQKAFAEAWPRLLAALGKARK